MMNIDVFNFLDRCKCEICQNEIKKIIKEMQKVNKAEGETHRERLSVEALDDKRLYKDDGTLNNPRCPICGEGRWSSLHQGCDSPPPTNK